MKKGFAKKVLVGVGAIGIITGSAVVAKRFVSPYEQVVQVIDGDSFKIGRDQTIRLSSLDAPEAEFCAGKESKKFLTQKIQGREVLLKELKTDRYGRVMAMVYSRSGENINEYMVKNGLALHIWDTSAQNAILDKANDYARENKLGIFSKECFQETPPNPKCAIKGSINPVTKEKTYTMPTCDRYTLTVVERYKGEDWFCTESEAKKAGYLRSKNCN